MIIISPYAKTAPGAATVNPKNYPYWDDVIGLLKKDYDLIQVGVTGEVPLVQDFRKGLPIQDLRKLIGQCDTWISVDSFFQHLCWDEGKKGVVIFSQSDPRIFGHVENINLLKDPKFLRGNQFQLWSQTAYNSDAYVTPELVVKTVTANFLLTDKSRLI